MTNDSEKLKEIGNNCDDIMRRCSIKIIKDVKLTDRYIRNDKIEIQNYFMDLNFKWKNDCQQTKFWQLD